MIFDKKSDEEKEPVELVFSESPRLSRLRSNRYSISMVARIYVNIRAEINIEDSRAQTSFYTQTCRAQSDQTVRSAVSRWRKNERHNVTKDEDEEKFEREN